MVTTPVTTTTTMPAMMAMSPVLPAVALGIVKAIFISKFYNLIGSLYTVRCKQNGTPEFWLPCIHQVNQCHRLVFP